jgi:hypothetical protein
MDASMELPQQLKVKNALLGMTDMGRTFEAPPQQKPFHIDEEAKMKFSVNNLEFFDLLTRDISWPRDSAVAENTRIIEEARKNQKQLADTSDDLNWSKASTIPLDAVYEAIRMTELPGDTECIP